MNKKINMDCGDKIVVLLLCLLFCAVILIVSCVHSKNRQNAVLSKKAAFELLEWTAGDGQMACIWIDGCTYYGSRIENVAGDNKFMVFRGENDYLILPDKIIVKQISE